MKCLGYDRHEEVAAACNICGLIEAVDTNSTCRSKGCGIGWPPEKLQNEDKINVGLTAQMAVAVYLGDLFKRS
jgi:hypothetical protein